MSVINLNTFEYPIVGLQAVKMRRYYKLVLTGFLPHLLNVISYLFSMNTSTQ